MQQYQVGKAQQKQQTTNSTKYQQYQTRSPFSSIENSQKQLFNQKASTDVESNRPLHMPQTPGLQNPYYNQYQQFKRSSNSNHQEPKANSKTQGSQDYSIQFKVGMKKSIDQKDPGNETNLSQMITNPQHYKQFTCMSPTQNRDNSLIFQSPQQRKEILQSPVINNQKTSYNLLSQQQSQQQLQFQQIPKGKQVINYTNTAQIQQELKQLQEQNLVLQTKAQTLESEISRGAQTGFIQELEKKIRLLSQMNVKLQQENAELQTIKDPEQMKLALNQLLNDRKQLQNSLNLIKNEISKWNSQIEELNEKCEEMSENQQIRDLVQELETKVQNLIVENDRLNNQLQENQQHNVNQEFNKSKQEYDALNTRYNQIKKDEDKYRHKYHDLSKQYDQLLEQNAYADLNEKIQLLVEENQRLQSVINESEVNDQDLEDLKERIRVVKQDNLKMERQLKKK